MDAHYVAAHIEEDRRHWWFRGRLAILLAVLGRVLPHRRLRLLELGCGTGNVLAALDRFGETVGVEANPELIAVARAAGLDVRPGRLPDAVPLPDGWADVVLLLDVLEHLEDEQAALATARQALGEDGVLVITVPAYAWLWSRHDEVLGHRRRYTARRLRAVLGAAGFRITYLGYFNTLLFPAMAMVRIVKRVRRRRDHDLGVPPAPINAALEWVFALERHLVPRGRLPFGASLLALARR